MPPLIRHITHIPSSRPAGGFFIPVIFPEKTCAELTKVNKLALRDSFTSNYKDVIFPTVKPANLLVNKKAVLTTYYLPLITLLSYYRINYLCPRKKYIT